MAKKKTDPAFVHMRAHSSYSLLEGAIAVPHLIDLAVADKQPALALCDTNNLFGALEFAEGASKKGLQPIIGCQIAVDGEDLACRGEAANEAANPSRDLSPIVLLAKSDQGYKNLLHVVSTAYKQADYYEGAYTRLAQLADHADGLIALGGGADGFIGQALQSGMDDLARKRLEALARIFSDRLYVELQRHGRAVEGQTESAFIALAYKLGLPLVATNEPFFATSDDFEAHDALLAIAQGRVIGDDDRRRLTPEHYFKSAAQMAALFADLPEALANTVEIARRCAVRAQARKPILPRFIDAKKAPAGAHADPDALEAEELRTQAHAGLADRLHKTGPAHAFTPDDYTARLDYELDVINRMKYAGYFLIVADFIKWAKERGIPVGPGRGSGAGSLVAYALTITDIDPLRYDIPFERFLNPERVSMPDFDIDFCQERRDEVIHYVRDKYGAEHVAQIITFGTLQARAVLRDVGRVLQMPYGHVDRICKLVPNNPADPVDLETAIAGEPQLQEMAEKDAVVGQLFRIAKKLEGLFRHASTHAAGVVIGDRPLHELVPLYRDPRAQMLTTQFNLKWIEVAGLVKFDFLGLRTLTIIDRTLGILRAQGVMIDLDTMPVDDAKTFRMLGRGETVGVFQLESAGMRRALMDLRPDRLEDIIAMVALYRPGPMASIPSYCARKNGSEPIDVIHPSLEPILKETFGVIVYQEQVMQIARDLAGYTLGEADLLRRAMGKKIRAEMDAHRARFIEGALRHGVAEQKANTIFDLMAKFSGYGFNKGHSAPYALIAYQTAWLKANHPAAFLAASMTIDMGNTDKLADFVREAARLEIPIRAPDINVSTDTFDVKAGEIVYALAAIKGVGRSAVVHIIEQRGQTPFSGIGDFAGRVSPRIINKRTLQGLIAAGAFDTIAPDRARLFAGAESVVSYGHRVADDAAVGQSDMFGDRGKSDELVLRDAPPWSLSEQLQREFDAIGFYLSAHPLDEYLPLLGTLKAQTWSEFSQAARQNGASAGRLLASVAHKRERRIRSGGRMAVLTCSDPSGMYEAVLFADNLAQFRPLLEPGNSVLLTVRADVQGEDVRLRVQNVEPLGGSTAKLPDRLRIHLHCDTALNSLGRHLPQGGEGRVILVLTMVEHAREVELHLEGHYDVTPQLAGAIRALPGVADAVLVA